jgi:hypothetical protein
MNRRIPVKAQMQTRSSSPVASLRSRTSNAHIRVPSRIILPSMRSQPIRIVKRVPVSYSTFPLRASAHHARFSGEISQMSPSTTARRWLMVLAFLLVPLRFFSPPPDRLSTLGVAAPEASWEVPPSSKDPSPVMRKSCQ